jgi:hypothetical protein
MIHEMNYPISPFAERAELEATAHWHRAGQGKRLAQYFLFQFGPRYEVAASLDADPRFASVVRAPADSLWLRAGWH